MFEKHKTKSTHHWLDFFQSDREKESHPKQISKTSLFILVGRNALKKKSLQTNMCKNDQRKEVMFFWWTEQILLTSSSEEFP